MADLPADDIVQTMQQLASDESEGIEALPETLVKVLLDGAAEITLLKEALADALTLMPPERWKLLLPQYESTRTKALSDD